MSDTTSPAHGRKVMATFSTREDAEAALQYLNAEAIPRDQVTVGASSAGQQPVQAPGETNGMVQEDENRSLRSMTTGIAASGAGMLAAGLVVATGGAALPAVAAAAAAGLGAGAATQTAAVSAAGDNVVPDAEKATTVVTVNALNADQAERAKGVLGKVSALHVWEE